MYGVLLRVSLAAVVGIVTPPTCGSDPDEKPGAKSKPKPNKLRSADLESFLPRWKVRDQWTIETVTKRVQRRKTLSADSLVTPIQWRFAVSKFEKSLGSECFRVDVSCLAGEHGHPRSVLWFDRQTLALRRMANEVPTRNGYRLITTSYVHDAGQPAPVLDLSSSLPIGAPLFLSQHAKGIDQFHYQTVFNPERKNLSEVPFSHTVTQSARSVGSEHVEQLFAERFPSFQPRDRFAKSLRAAATAEVIIKSGDQEMLQLCQAGQPWPIYSESGYTASRLVSSERPLSREGDKR